MDVFNAIKNLIVTSRGSSSGRPSEMESKWRVGKWGERDVDVCHELVAVVGVDEGDEKAGMAEQLAKHSKGLMWPCSGKERSLREI
ncbi:hypothetical protein M0R45_029074 [Rubus argutus]|uniref:Uncharacterized protein n=1 Tax=Rubus argutus TaxID=59490 RepID=A0AAW1WAL1_RUBAR